jgi:hypothetical protein
VKKTWVSAIIVLVTLVPVFLQGFVVARAGFFAGDFRAFYCAARVAYEGADPYLNEPLHSCEDSIGPRTFFEKYPGVTVPAPLPGYAILLVLPFSFLPFNVAAVLWLLLLFLAWYVCITTIVRCAGITWQTALALTTLSLGASSIPFGEVVPLALAGICASAYFAWKEQWDAAGVAAMVSMLEPHLGLPTCVALAVFAPAARWSLVLSFAALASLAFLMLGTSINIEYFTTVLPAHALSEASRDTQYSLTAVLTSFGISDATAIRAGSIWYGMMVLAGTIVAGLLARKMRNGAFIACVPPAFAVFGGTFIHVTQLVAALPAIVVTIPYVSGSRRVVAVISLLLLAVPWTFSVAVAMAPAFPVAYLAWIYWEGSARAAAIAGVTAGVFLIALTWAYGNVTHPLLLAHPPPVIDPKLAEAAWSVFTSRSSGHGVVSWIERMPTWTGLALLLAILCVETQSASAKRVKSLRYFTREVP